MLSFPMFSSRASSFPLASSSLRSNSPIFTLDSANSLPSVPDSPFLFSPKFSASRFQRRHRNAANPFRIRSPKKHISNLFRINTCRSVSKQRTLSPSRMNTYAKTRGEEVLLLTKNLANSLSLKLQTGVALVGKERGALHRSSRLRILLRPSLGGGGALKLDGNLLFAWRFALLDFS